MSDLSVKAQKLIAMYDSMAEVGYTRRDGVKVKNSYNDFELSRFRGAVKPIFDRNSIRSVLDYGCGGSDWYSQMIFDGKSAKEYFRVEEVLRYEPARRVDERRLSDLVCCFDVLEHIHILDIPAIVNDLFFFSRKALLVNVACYPAQALLPNGENAHITIRDPSFWYGVFSTVCMKFPHVEVNLFCSTSYQNVVYFGPFSASGWEKGRGFST